MPFALVLLFSPNFRSLLEPVLALDLDPSLLDPQKLSFIASSTRLYPKSKSSCLRVKYLIAFAPNVT